MVMAAAAGRPWLDGHHDPEPVKGAYGVGFAADP